jgi:Zn-dependent alcohol dehydrogenase
VKAAVCRRFGEPLAIEEIDIAAPHAGEISVRLRACAVCHSDIHYVQGSWGGTLPAVYGHEGAGIVDEVGPGVTGPEPGDHVVVTLIRSCGSCFFCARGEPALCGSAFALDDRSPLTDRAGAPIVQGLRTGAFAEYAVVDASQVAVIPKDVPLESACLLGCGVITGVGAVVNTARVEEGSTVVVVGTGGVGLNAVQGAVLSGARTIMAVDLGDLKLEAASALGATHAVNPKADDVEAAVAAATGGRGADYVFVTAGASAAVEQGITLARRGGTVVVVGIPASGQTITLDPGLLADSGRRLVGSKMGSARVAVDVPRLVELYQKGLLKLDELISGRYPLEEINEAIASAARGEALRNVIVF